MTILKEITQDWIKFLKNNQIANLQSNPNSGRLSYRRNPNVGDLLKFLTNRDEFDETDINRAIRSVISSRPEKEAPTSALSTWHHTEIKPGQRNPQLGDTDQNNTTDQKKYSNDDAEDIDTRDKLSTWKNTDITPGERLPKNQIDNKTSDNTTSQKKYSNNDVEDVDFRDAEKELKRIPQSPDKPASRKPITRHKRKEKKVSPVQPSPTDEPPRKPRFKLRTKKINEDFYDHLGEELSEKEVKQVFNILLAPKPPKEKPKKEELTPEEQLLKKQEDMRRIKYLIRDVMTPAQRKTLWRILNEE
jgi:hypothetical protein